MPHVPTLILLWKYLVVRSTSSWNGIFQLICQVRWHLRITTQLGTMPQKLYIPYWSWNKDITVEPKGHLFWGVQPVSLEPNVISLSYCFAGTVARGSCCVSGNIQIGLYEIPFVSIYLSFSLFSCARRIRRKPYFSHVLRVWIFIIVM